LSASPELAQGCPEIHETVSAQGADQDEMLFDGQKINDTYEGKLLAYAGKRCGTREYDVSGPITNGMTTVTLIGRAPQFDSDCQKTGEEGRTLIFNFKYREQ
jgi:hypothetical protein